MSPETSREREREKERNRQSSDAGCPGLAMLGVASDNGRGLALFIQTRVVVGQNCTVL